METTNSHFTIKSFIFLNILGPGGEGLVQLKVRKEGGMPGYINKTIKVNEPPVPGDCTCSPTTGEGYKTDFQVSCNGWEDPDKPLSYSFSYGDGDDATPVLTSKENPSSSRKFKIYKLPEDGISSIQIKITVSVEDSLGLRSKVDVSVEVKKGEKVTVDLSDLGSSLGSGSATINNEEEAREMTQNVGNILAQLALSSKVTPPQTTVGTVIKPTSETTTKQEHGGEIEEDNIHVSEGVTPTPTTANLSPEQIQHATIIEKSISTLTLITAVVASSDKTTNSELLVITDTLETATANKDVLTLNARDESANLLNGMVEAIFKRTDAPMSFLERVAATLLKSAANLLNSLSNGPAISSDGSVHSCDDKIKERSRNASRTILNAINKICTAILRAKTPGDADTVINTTTIAVKLQKKFVNLMTALEIEQDLGMFKLPKDELFPDKNLTGNDVINFQMLSFKNNPHKLCAEDNITSSVVALEVKRSNGSKFSISGLQNYIDMRIHHKERAFDPDQESFVLQLDDASTQFHTFTNSFPNVAVAIEFLSQTEIVFQWTIMVAYGGRPSLRDNLVSWSFNGKERKLFLLEPSLLTEKGTYYIQVQAAAKIKRSYLKETISVNASYSLKISTLKCLYWNEEIEGWSLDGCRAGPETTSTEVQCLCNHLTSFAAHVFVEPNAIHFQKAFQGFVELSENPMVLSVVLAILGVYLLLLIWARRRDIRNAKKAETIPLEENEPSDRYKYEVLVLTGMRKGAGTTADVCCDLIGLDGESGPRLLWDPSQVRFQRSGMDSFLLTTAKHLGDITFLKIWHNNSGSSPPWYLKQVIIRDLKTDCVFVFMCNRWLAVEFDDGEVLRTLSSARQDDLKSFNHLFQNVTQKDIMDNHLWFSVFTRPQISSFTTAQRLSCCLALLYCTMLANAMFYQLDGVSDPSITLNLGPISVSPRQVYIGVISSLLIFPVNLAIVGLFRNIGAKLPNEKKSNVPQTPNPKTKKRARAYKGDFKDIVQWYRNQDQEEELHSEGLESITVGLPPVETVNTDKKTTEWLNMSINSCDSQSCLAGSDQNDWQGCEIDFDVSEERNVQVQFNEKSGSLNRKKRKLPHWCVYVAWLGVFAVSFVSAFFVTLYGFQFGREKASQWLASLLISLVQDVLISQPIKVLLVALFIAIIIKKPQEQVETNNLEDEETDEDEDEHGIGNFEHELPEYRKFMYRRYEQRPLTKLEPPDLTELSNARELRKREIRMSQILKEIITYVLFLLALFVVSFGQRDPKAYLVAKLIEDTYLGGVYTGQQLSETDGVDNYWKWIEGTVLPSLSSSSRDWAEGCHPLQEYTVDCNSRLVGAARVRQVRVSEESCQVPGPLRKTISTCNGFYSYFKEDKNNYSVGWQMINRTSLNMTSSNMTSSNMASSNTTSSNMTSAKTTSSNATSSNKTSNTTTSPWNYQTMDELGGIPFLGTMATYGGGGYSFDLAFSNMTGAYLNSLKQNSWIDSRTRAIFVEVAIYSAQVNLFGVATFLTEWIPTNGIIYFNNVKVARLYRHGNDFQVVMLVCEIFLAIFVALFIYNEIKKVYRLRKSYFRDPWNWLEIAQIVLILTCAGALVQRSFFTQQSIEQMKSNPKKFINFIQTITWDELFGYSLAFLVFFANLKLLKLMRFNHRIYLFTKTLCTAASPLMSFMVVFFVFYAAYCVLFYAMFGSILPEYRSFLTTIETLFNTIMGAFDFEILRESNRFLGPIIFFSFMMIMVMILMNVFLTILMDAFAEVQEDEHLLKSEDSEVIELMMKRFKYFFARTDKVDILEETDNVSGTNCSPANDHEVNSSINKPESDTASFKSISENWLKQPQENSNGMDLQLAAARAVQASLSSIEDAVDSSHIRHGESGEEHSSTSSSFMSLANERVEMKNFQASPDYDRSGESLIEEGTSGIYSESSHESPKFSRKSSMVSNREEKEYFERFNEECLPSKDCYPQDSCSSKPAEPLILSKSRRSSSSGYSSSFVGTDNSNDGTELSGKSEVSHYYDLLDKALDNLNAECFLGSKEDNASMEPEMSYYYRLLEKATKEHNQDMKEGTNALKKFDFTDYQIGNNNFGNTLGDDCESENKLEVEPMLSELSGIFTNVTMSEIQEDQLYEELLKTYVTSLNEVSFEPNPDTMETQLMKRFDKKAKWMYTRHMYTEK